MLKNNYKSALFCFFLFFSFCLIFMSCQVNKKKPKLKEIVTVEDVQIGAFMLNGSGYTLHMQLFVDNGSLDCRILSFNKENPQNVVVDSLSKTDPAGSLWDDVALFESSIDVAENINVKIQEYDSFCIEIKVLSLSLSTDDEIYLLYTKNV